MTNVLDLCDYDPPKPSSIGPNEVKGKVLIFTGSKRPVPSTTVVVVENGEVKK